MILTLQEMKDIEDFLEANDIQVEELLEAYTERNYHLG